MCILYEVCIKKTPLGNEDERLSLCSNRVTLNNVRIIQNEGNLEKINEQVNVNN